MCALRIAVCLLMLIGAYAGRWNHSISPMSNKIKYLEQMFNKEDSMKAWPIQYEYRSNLQDHMITEIGSSNALFDSSPSIITVDSLVIHGETLTTKVEIRNKVIITKDFIILDKASEPQVSMRNVTLLATLVLLDRLQQVTNCSIVAEYFKILATKITGLTAVSKLAMLKVDSTLSKSVVVSNNLVISDETLRNIGTVFILHNVFLSSDLQHLTGQSHLVVTKNVFIFRNAKLLLGSGCNYQENVFVGERLMISNRETLDAIQLPFTAGPSDFLSNKFYLEKRLNSFVLSGSNTVVDIRQSDVSPIIVENLQSCVAQATQEVFDYFSAEIGDTSNAIRMVNFSVLIVNSSKVMREPLKLDEAKMLKSDVPLEHSAFNNFVPLNVSVKWSVNEFWIGISTHLVDVLPSMFTSFESRAIVRTKAQEIHKFPPSMFRILTTLQFNRQFFARVQTNLNDIRLKRNNYNSRCGEKQALSTWINLQNEVRYLYLANQAENIFSEEDTERLFHGKDINFFGTKDFVLRSVVLIGHTVNFNTGLLSTSHLTIMNVTIVADKVKFRVLQSDLMVSFCLIVADDVLFDLIDEKGSVTLKMCTVIAKNIWLNSKERYVPYELSSIVAANFVDSKLFAQSVELNGSNVNFLRLFLAANKLRFNFSSWLMLDTIIIAETAMLEQHGRHLNGSRTIAETKFLAKTLSARSFESVNRNSVLVADKLVLLCEQNRSYVFHRVSNIIASLHHQHCFRYKNRAQNQLAALQLKRDRLQPSQIAEILLRAFERSADSVLSFKLQPANDSVYLLHHLFDLLSPIQTVVLAKLDLCSGHVLYNKENGFLRIETSDLFTSINVSFSVSISANLLKMIADFTMNGDSYYEPCQTRKPVCPAKETQIPQTKTTAANEATENDAEYYDSISDGSDSVVTDAMHGSSLQSATDVKKFNDENGVSVTIKQSHTEQEAINQSEDAVTPPSSLHSTSAVFTKSATSSKSEYTSGPEKETSTSTFASFVSVSSQSFEEEVLKDGREPSVGLTKSTPSAQSTDSLHSADNVELTSFTTTTTQESSVAVNSETFEKDVLKSEWEPSVGLTKSTFSAQLTDSLHNADNEELISFTTTTQESSVAVNMVTFEKEVLKSEWEPSVGLTKSTPSAQLTDSLHTADNEELTSFTTTTQESSVAVNSESSENEVIEDWEPSAGLNVIPNMNEVSITTQTAEVKMTKSVGQVEVTEDNVLSLGQTFRSSVLLTIASIVGIFFFAGFVLASVITFYDVVGSVRNRFSIPATLVLPKLAKSAYNSALKETVFTATPRTRSLVSFCNSSPLIQPGSALRASLPDTSRRN